MPSLDIGPRVRHRIEDRRVREPDIRVAVAAGDEDATIRQRRVAAQNRSAMLLYGTWVNVLDTGSQTRGFVPLSVELSKISSFPFGSMLVWIGTIGSVVGVLQRPTCAGSEPLLATVTVTGVAVVSLPAASRAVAVSVCEPLPPRVVSQLTCTGGRSSTPRAPRRA